MDFVQKRQKDAEYLKTVIAQRQIMIEECQRQKNMANKKIQSLTAKITSLETELYNEKNKSTKQSTNLTMALKQLEHQNEQLQGEKNQLQFQLNAAKMKIQQQMKQQTKQIYRLKNQYESQKDSLNQKISKLQKNLTTLNTHYRVQQSINQDKHKIIEDANRNLRGFANEKQQRMIIIQNQQLTNQIEFQSRQITGLLEKSEKLQDQIKQYKMDLELHKNIQNDLVKRSSLAQNLIKQLNQRIKELERQLQQKGVGSNTNIKQSKITERRVNQSQKQSRVSSAPEEINVRQMQETIAKLKFQNANLKNFNHFLQTTQRNNNKKYQSLGEIMAQHLQMILYKNRGQQEQTIQGSTLLNIDLNELKSKEIRQWKPQQTQVILNLLITQIKPYISKSSLISFPEVKNIKVSFVEEQNKEPISLPKIIQDYEKNQQKQVAKKGNRFKDIPVDISTKILRSNLRQWGTKVSYGSNIPRNRRQVSKSIIVEGEKPLI